MKAMSGVIYDPTPKHGFQTARGTWPRGPQMNWFQIIWFQIGLGPLYISPEDDGPESERDKSVRTMTASLVLTELRTLNRMAETVLSANPTSPVE